MGNTSKRKGKRGRSPSTGRLAEAARVDKPAALDRLALRTAPFVLLLYAGLLLYVVFGHHAIPLYGVETDLFGDAIPAARALVRGQDLVPHFEFKGPGYPLLLAAATPLAGNEWTAARLVNVLAAVAGAAGSFLLVRRFLGDAAGLFVLLGLAVNATYWQAAIEAGTDLPAFALSIWSAHLALYGRRLGWTLAGLLAGFAVVTRYNAAFLLPAALASAWRRPKPLRSALLYLAGAAIPLGAWVAWQAATTGDPLGNRNYLNLAFTFYGQGQSWETFWTETAGRFESLGDVLTYDPGTVARTVGSNLLGHLALDAKELVTMPLGAVAVVGLFLAVPGRAGSLGFLLYFSLAYLSLAFIFYAPRFFLFLLPFYLAGAAALLLSGGEAPLWHHRLPTPPAIGRLLRRAGVLAAAVLLVVSAGAAVGRVTSLLANPIVELPAAARALRERARPGETVMARKPQIAYFANLAYEPFPAALALSDLLVSARERGADYLYFSGIEARFRPHLRSLLEARNGLPGLEYLASEDFDEDSYYTLFRFTGESVSAADADRALLAVHEGYVSRHPEDVEAVRLLGEMLLHEGEPARALAHLEAASRSHPRNVAILTSKAYAEYATGDLGSAEASTRQALALRSDLAWANGFLGQILLDRGRAEEAGASLERALAIEPANPSYRFLLGAARVRQGHYGAAAEDFLGVLRLDPSFLRARAAAARSLAWDGQVERALVLLIEWERDAPGHPDRELSGLRDSLRATHRSLGS